MKSIARSMISPNMILRPLYHIENENQSQNPAHSNVSNPPIFGTVCPNPLGEG